VKRPTLISLFKQTETGLKIDKLKVDRSFIAKLLDTREDLSIVTAIIQVARAYGLQTTAEGIEEHGAIAQLVSLGCDLGQGFHFSRPVPAEEIGKMLAPAALLPT
jgi:EAL domain-containing protein (putative c-di-GMP-specific phosphodiesterase class I)